jgi:CBS domain containing-hemolysin-like protein
VVRLFGLEPGATEDSHLHSPEELKLLVAASQKGGLLDAQQQELLERVLSIGEREISEVMTPRPDIIWIDLDDPLPAALKRIRETPHDHIVLCRGSIDELVGVVRKQDICNVQIDGGPIDLEAIAREPLAVHESASILKVLEEFRQKSVHLAIVVDEYGGLEGLVTHADLLSAIAGQMPAAPGEEREITERADGSLLFDGMVPVFDAFERLGLKLPSDDDFNTIAGFALHELGRIPQAGDAFSYDGHRFEVIDMDGRRIDKLLVVRERPRGA